MLDTYFSSSLLPYFPRTLHLPLLPPSPTPPLLPFVYIQSTVLSLAALATLCIPWAVSGSPSICLWKSSCIPHLYQPAAITLFSSFSNRYWCQTSWLRKLIWTQRRNGQHLDWLIHFIDWLIWYNFEWFCTFWLLISCVSKHIGGAAYTDVGLAGWHDSAARRAPRYIITWFSVALDHMTCTVYWESTLATRSPLVTCVSDDWHSLRATKAWSRRRQAAPYDAVARGWPRALEILLKNLSTYFWQVVLVLEKCVWIADMFNNVAKWFESISGKKLAGPKELA